MSLPAQTAIRPAKAPLWTKPGSFLPRHQGRQYATHHGHQRVDRHQTGDLLQVAGAHHIKTEPPHRQDPGAKRQKRDIADRDRMGLAANIAPHARPEDQDRRQGDPAANGVNHHRSGIVVELSAANGLEQPLQKRHILSPNQGFKQGVGNPRKDRTGDDLWPELGAFGNTARDDGRNAGSKAEQEEVMHQVIALGLAEQLFRRF